MQTLSPAAPALAGPMLTLPDEEATRRLAADVANMLEPGDFIALSGDLGAGKTTFVRAMIAHLANDAAVEVPSPTFTLVQHDGAERRTVQMEGRGAATGRVDRLGAMLAFLDKAGFGAAARARIAGDASSRSYERLHLDGGP